MKAENFYRFLPVLPLLVTGCSGIEKKTDIPDKPNIIFILADDLGYGDAGCYGQDSIPTPNIDRMAGQGMLFTQHYAGSTVCAPSRCALMTGLHTGHARIRGNARVPLKTEDITVAELLKKNGYKTALFGKWGLGLNGTTGTPNLKGFDQFTGYLSQRRAHNAYPDWIWEDEDTLWLDNDVILVGGSPTREPGGAATAKRTHTQDVFTSKSIDFIKSEKDNPFFLYLAYTLPHANNEAQQLGLIGMESPDTSLFNNKDWPAEQRAHAGMIASLDKDIGKILDLLNELGIAENTLVIFTSDNGPHAEGGAIPEFFNSNGDLKGIKRDLYEGGIRVPMIAWWPGTVESGTRSDHISAFWDFLPTACEISGTEIPSTTDGISYLPELLGKDQKEHDYLYWEFFEQGGKTAIRKGPWKAVRLGVNSNPDTEIELYDLGQDIGENTDISGSHPEEIEMFKDLFSKARTKSADFMFSYEKTGEK